jgi:hypothetical protein
MLGYLRCASVPLRSGSTLSSIFGNHSGLNRHGRDFMEEILELIVALGNVID